MGISAASSAFAAFITAPLDLAKVILQLNINDSSHMEKRSGLNFRSNSNGFSVLYLIHRKNGLRGLFRGAFARVRP